MATGENHVRLTGSRVRELRAAQNLPTRSTQRPRAHIRPRPLYDDLRTTRTITYGRRQLGVAYSRN